MTSPAAVVASRTPAPKTRFPRARHAPGAGDLCSSDGVTETEALMECLSFGAPADPAGAMVREHLATGGKRLRARLALSALEALGGERRDGIAWAAACELLHNATLIHDDIQDGDRVRREQPALWARHGVSQAINAGDLMLMLPFLAVGQVDASPEVCRALTHALATHAAATVRGQAAELALPGTPEFGWEMYLRAVGGKTSALFQLPVEGAALLAGRSPDEARSLASAFAPLGTLFQLQDDVLDLWGDKGRGAPGSDLREGKVSALVVEHLRLHPEDRSWLLALLSAPREATPDADVERAVGRFRADGALRGVLGRIERQAAAAIASPALGSERALRELALELVEVILAPISHVGIDVGEHASPAPEIRG